MNDKDDSEDIARRAYDLYRELQPRARSWSDLSRNDKAMLIFVAHFLRVSGTAERDDRGERLDPRAFNPRGTEGS